MICPKCGTALPSGSVLCRRCRTPTMSGSVPGPAASAGVSRGVPGGLLKRPGLITLLAVLHFLNAGLMALAILGCLASLGQKNPLGLPFAAVFLVIGGLSFLAGMGLWKLESFGRTLQIVFSCFGLLGIPFGTLISILILIYLNKPGVQVLFSGKSERDLTAEERFALQSMSDSGAVIVIVAVIFVAGIAMAGIIAAIAVPNFLMAVQRAKQKRTMADMKAVASSIEQYRQVNNRLPEGGTVGEIASAIHSNVKVDAWGNEMRYVSNGQNYWILSAGKDGQFEHTFASEYKESATRNYDADIVMLNGEWLEAPEAAVGDRSR